MKLMTGVLRAAALMLLGLLLLTVALAIGLYHGAAEVGQWPLISIDGHDLHFGALGVEQALGAALAVVVTLVVVCTVVPLALLGAGFAVMCAFGVAALAVGGVALLLFSPLILAGLVAWWLVRRSRRTTMAA